MMTNEEKAWSIESGMIRHFCDETYVEELILPDWCTVRDLTDKILQDPDKYPYGKIFIMLKKDDDLTSQTIGEMDFKEKEITSPIDESWMKHRIYTASIHHLWNDKRIAIWVEQDENR